MVQLDRQRTTRGGRLALALGMLLALLTVGARPASDQWYAVDPTATLTQGPLLGAASDTGLSLWARASRGGRLQVEVKPADQADWSGRPAGQVDLTLDGDFAGVVELGGLAPATRYDYRLALDGRSLEQGGSFRTLPPAGRPATFRFSLGGDLAASFAPFTILDRLREQRPDFNLLLGDLIYADHPEPIPASLEAYRSKYQANWSDPSFALLTRAVPSFMMWDDHEITNDYDAGRVGRYIPARAALDEFVADHNPAPARPGELYYSFQVADVDFFVLDTRSYRSPDHQQDGPDKTMLGAVQKADLKAWLAASRAPFKVVLSSVALHDFGRLRDDCWTAFATERAELLEFVRRRGIEGVVVLSGDQHWSSLVRHDPYPVWEFNATPLAQSIIPAPPTDDPRLVLRYDASPAFGIVDVDTTGPTATMRFAVVDNLGATRAQYQISAARR